MAMGTLRRKPLREARRKDDRRKDAHAHGDMPHNPMTCAQCGRVFRQREAAVYAELATIALRMGTE